MEQAPSSEVPEQKEFVVHPEEGRSTSPKANVDEVVPAGPSKDKEGQKETAMEQDQAPRSKVPEPKGLAVHPEEGRSTSPTDLEKVNQALREALEQRKRQADSLQKGEKSPQEKQEGQPSVHKKAGEQQKMHAQGHNQGQKLTQAATGIASLPERGRSTSPA